MLKNETYFIDSCDDEELGIKRESKLEFKLTYDDSKDIKAIVCIIPGLGADINSDIYVSDFCARNYDVAVLGVNYHCIGNRPDTGAAFYLDTMDKFIFEANLKALNITIPYDIQKLNTFEEFHPAMDYLNKKIQTMKDDWELNRDYFLNLSLTFKPARDEYQNFGIMQAIDVLNAILYTKNHILKMGGGIKTILIGASHGGYLANLCAKIAPWNIDNIVDNSSYAKTCLRLIGFEKEVDYTKYYGFLTPNVSNNIIIFGFDKTHWTTNKQSPFYFSPARKLIRQTLNEDHLIIQAKYPKPKYIAYHSKFDQYVPLEEKEIYFDILKNLGFEIEFNKICDEKEIDGKFIKTLEHGLGMSIKTLIKKHLSKILEE
ncbi:DUF2920 family protein, partial [Campylobacter lari]|nr:DUF2920 family protein [Campylobacter lari]